MDSASMLTERESFLQTYTSAEVAKRPGRVEEFLRAVPAIVFAINLEGMITFSSGSGLRPLGYEPDQLVGTSIFDIYPDRPDFRDDFIRATSGAEFRLQTTLADRIFDTQYTPLFDHHGELEGSLGISVDVTELVHTQRSLQQLALIDPATGLASRAHVETLVDTLLSSTHTVSVLLVDIDGFRDINDTYCHAVGDEVLRQVGARLCDARPACSIVGRFGGDQFAVAIQDTDQDRVTKYATSLLTEISRPLQVNLIVDDAPTYAELRLSASIGIAFADTYSSPTTASLLSRADSASHVAKRSGGGTYACYSADHDRSARRLSVSTRIRHAIASGDIATEYQPIVRIQDRSIAGFEALARWTDPILGSVCPSEFIPLIEASPLIDDLFDAVLHQALSAALAWQSDSGVHPPAWVSVNLSPRQLRNPALPDLILRAVTEVGLPTDLLTLELTETAILEPDPITDRALSVLREAGIGFHLDDFGVGYSNMARLGELIAKGVLRSVKIDRQLVQPLPDDDARSLLNALRTMTHALGLDVIAEGVESDAQLAALTSLGYDYAQGWLFHRSMPAHAARELILGQRE
jgi:diguanylate cyclase (GGDEF)-like protein/PAS domain S-box-containing protein